MALNTDVFMLYFPFTNCICAGLFLYVLCDFIQFFLLHFKFFTVNERKRL